MLGSTWAFNDRCSDIFVNRVKDDILNLFFQAQSYKRCFLCKT